MCDQGKNEENIRTIYKELCTSYRSIDDFRTKLLGFLPLATGGIFAFLIDPKFFADGKAETVTNQLLPMVGGLGTLVTLGLYAFEVYGIRKCTALIKVGEHLEHVLRSQHGQFTARPDVHQRAIGRRHHLPHGAGVLDLSCAVWHCPGDCLHLGRSHLLRLLSALAAVHCVAAAIRNSPTGRDIGTRRRVQANRHRCHK